MDARIPKGLTPMRVKVLATALPEVGTREATGKNDGPVTKYMPAWAADLGKPYCAWGVGWAFKQALGLYPYGTHIGGVWDVYQAALSKDEIVPTSPGPFDISVQPGDIGIILYDADGNPATRDPGHLVLVCRVNQDGTLVNCVEWNWKNQVGFTTRRVQEFIAFCNPYGRLFGPTERSSVTWERGIVAAPMGSGNAASTR